MKAKTVTGLFALCFVAFAATDAFAVQEETKLTLPDGKPASEAVVFSVNKTQRPLLMVNSGSKFQPNPMASNGKELIGVDDINGATFNRADEDGIVDIDREGHAHLVVAKSGESMAFVPRGTTGDVALRKCGRIRMDYSTFQKVAVREALKESKPARDVLREKGYLPPVSEKEAEKDWIKDVTVIANWKNSLAGTYAIVESEPDEYRLHDWFDIQFIFPDPHAEVSVPPGEISVGLLTGEQIEEMCKFRFEKSEVLFNKTLRGFCISSGIHSVTSDEVTRPPAFLGVSATGMIREYQHYPKWDDDSILKDAEITGSAINMTGGSPSSADLKDPDNYVKWLLGKGGRARRIRVTNQLVWLKNNGAFLTPPYAIANYQFHFYPSPANQPESWRSKGHRKGWHIADKQKQPIKFEVAAWPVPKKEIVDFGIVFFDDGENYEPDPPANSTAGFKQYSRINRPTPPAKSNRPSRNGVALSSRPNESRPIRRVPPNRVPVVIDEKPEVTNKGLAPLREKVAGEVKAKIATRKKQLMELEERIKAARERLRKREENIEDLIDQQLKKLLKSSDVDVERAFSFYLGIIR